MNSSKNESCDSCEENSTCRNVISQYADVKVPLRLMPYANVGKSCTELFGEPRISSFSNQAANCCSKCEILITQTICIRIPIEYGVNTDVGEIIAVCEKSNNCCNNSCK